MTDSSSYTAPDERDTHTSPLTFYDLTLPGNRLKGIMTDFDPNSRLGYLAVVTAVVVVLAVAVVVDPSSGPVRNY